VEYRLADVANAPVAANDALYAMRWLEKHASEHKLQGKRLRTTTLPLPPKSLNGRALNRVRQR